ncbi:MAG: hypothetical protein RDV48_00195 [Candidatus Eremiobacteraeota bacterium]|nr:hypothetical protein [Candidatus Eremiobacteraeota bacterium]
MAEEEQGSFWDKIKNIREITCKACGHKNPQDHTMCEECGKKLPLDDDALAINAVAGEVRTPGKMGKIPIEEAKTLNVLRDICEKIQSGTIPLEEFKKTHAKIQNIASIGVALWDTEAGKHLVGKLEGEEKELADKQHQEFRNFNEGVARIGNYLKSNDLKDVAEGFKMAEKAMVTLDQIQDRQLEIVNSKS